MSCTRYTTLHYTLLCWTITSTYYTIHYYCAVLWYGACVHPDLLWRHRDRVSSCALLFYTVMHLKQNYTSFYWTSLQNCTIVFCTMLYCTSLYLSTRLNYTKLSNQPLRLDPHRHRVSLSERGMRTVSLYLHRRSISPNVRIWRPYVRT